MHLFLIFPDYDCYSDTQNNFNRKKELAQKRKLQIEFEIIFQTNHSLDVSLKRKADGISIIIIQRMTTKKTVRAILCYNKVLVDDKWSIFTRKVLDFSWQISQFFTNLIALIIFCTEKKIIFSSQAISDAGINTGVIPISLFLLATGTVLRKAAIDRGVRLATGRYGCRQINKPSNSTVSVLI